MVGYVTVGTNDLERAAAFYDELLAIVGGRRWMVSDTFVAWLNSPNGPAFSVHRPFDGQPATVGNGVMVALVTGSREQVNQLHQKALDLGGRDEGMPGFRGGNFYAAYFRDLDGNKLNAFFIG